MANFKMHAMHIFELTIYMFFNETLESLGMKAEIYLNSHHHKVTWTIPCKSRTMLKQLMGAQERKKMMLTPIKMLKIILIMMTMMKIMLSIMDQRMTVPKILNDTDTFLAPNIFDTADTSGWKNEKFLIPVPIPADSKNLATKVNCLA